MKKWLEEASLTSGSCFLKIPSNETIKSGNRSAKVIFISWIIILPQKAHHESRVEQMQNGVLFSSDVDVDRKILARFIGVANREVVIRVQIPEKVPAGDHITLDDSG